MLLNIEQPVAEQEARHPGANVRAIAHSSGYDPLQMYLPAMLLELEEGGQPKPAAAVAAPVPPATAATAASVSPLLPVSSRARGPNFHRSAAGESLIKAADNDDDDDGRDGDQSQGRRIPASSRSSVGPTATAAPQRPRGRRKARPADTQFGEPPSDSELSDANPSANQGRRVTAGQVRLAAMQCMCAIVKHASKRAVQRFWLSFVPEHDDSLGDGDPSLRSLYSSLRLEPMPRNRAAALTCLAALLDGAKPFLMSAGKDVVAEAAKYGLIWLIYLVPTQLSSRHRAQRGVYAVLQRLG